MNIITKNRINVSINVNQTIYIKVVTSIQFKNAVLLDISIQNRLIKRKKTFIDPVILNFNEVLIKKTKC